MVQRPWLRLGPHEGKGRIMELKFVNEADTARDILAMLREQADNMEAVTHDSRPTSLALAPHHDHAADIAGVLRKQIADAEAQLGSLRAALSALEGPGDAELEAVAVEHEHEDRANVAVSTDQVFATVLAGEDQAAVIARKLDAPLPTVRAHLVALEADGRAVRSGEKRRTRWHPKARPAHPRVR